MGFSNLIIADTAQWRELLRYSIFGESTTQNDSIHNGGKTADQGWVGGNAGIYIAHGSSTAGQQTNIRGPIAVRGNLYTTDGGNCGDPAIITSTPCAFFGSWVRVLGSINSPGGVWYSDRVEVDGNITIGNGGSSAKFNDTTWTGGTITGINISNSRFVAPAWVSTANVAGYNTTYSTSHGGATPFSAHPVAYTKQSLSTLTIPLADFSTYTASATRPDIAVNHGVSRTWRQANSLPASYLPRVRADSILPPGVYGNLTFTDGGNCGSFPTNPNTCGTRIYLDSGIYYFTSIQMANWSEVIISQPQANRTMIFVKDHLNFGDASFFGPAMAHGTRGPVDAQYSLGWAYPAGQSPEYDPNYRGGTVLLYTDQTTNFTFSKHATVWASLLVPRVRAYLEDPSHMFGQIMAEWVVTQNWFDGGGTSGRYIPFFPDLPIVNIVFTNGGAITEGNSGTKPFPLTFSMHHENGVPVTVYFHTRNVTTSDPAATAGVDYQGITKDSVVFPVGDTAVDFSKILVNGDVSFELHEYFEIKIDSVKNGVLGPSRSDSVYVLRISNDDPPPSMYFTSTSDTSASEAVLGGIVNIPIRLNATTNVLNAFARVTITHSSGTVGATHPDTVYIPMNQLNGVIPVTVNNDNRYEPSDTLTITLTVLDASLTQIGTPSTRKLVMTSEDPMPIMQWDSTQVTINEGDSINLMSRINRQSAYTTSVSIGVYHSSGTLISEYTIPTTMSIGADVLTQFVKFKSNQDLFDEPDDTVFVRMFNPINATLGARDTLMVIIRDNDSPPNVQWDSVTVTINEGDTANLGAALSLMSYYNVTVQAAATSGSSGTTAGEYQLLTSSLGFTSPAIASSIKLRSIQDNNDEPDDTVFVTLSSPNNATLGSRTVVRVVIRDNDPPPVLQWDSVTVTIPEGGSVDLVARLNFMSFFNTSVSVSAAGGSRTTASEYTLSATNIAIASPGLTGSVRITSIADNTDEPNDTVRVTLSSPSLATLGTRVVVTVVIVDDDAFTSLDNAMQTLFTVSEPAGASTTLKIPILLAQASEWDIPWSVLPVAGSGNNHAQLDQDYRLVRSSGSIPAGQLSDTIVVEILGDIWDEADELFRLAFNPIAGSTNHLNYSGKDSIRVTILNNDGPTLSDTTVRLAENPPAGVRVSRLAGLLTASDTVMTYNWTLLPTGDASYFGVGLIPGQGWNLVVADPSVMDFEAHPLPFVLQLQVCGTFHCDTNTVQIQLTDVMENPVILPSDSMPVFENSNGGVLVDTLFVADGSGWGITWRIDGGTGAPNFQIDSVTGVITVRPGVNLDYEATRTQDLTVIVTNASGFADTIHVGIKLQNILEYSTVSIDVAQIPEGPRYVTPDTLWINADSLDLEWTHDLGDSIETIGFNRDGIALVIRTFCDPTKDFCGTDTLVVRRNTQMPQIVWVPAEEQDTVPRYTVSMPRDSGDTRIYTNNPRSVYGGSISYIDSTGRLVTVPFTAPTVLREGEDVLVIRTFTDPYGNTVSDTVVVQLDTQAPNVNILSPGEGTKFWVYNIDVIWSVDGVIMDTLNRASLEKGENRIIRRYMDLAGNMGADTVIVTLDGKKNDIQISIVEPMVEIKPAQVEVIRAQYPSRPDERFSFTVVNQQTLDEQELQWGTTGKVNTPAESERRIYDGRVNPHLGPTLRIEARFQHVGGINGEGMPRGGTLADLMERLNEEGIDEEDALCGESMPVDPFTTPLWRNTLKVEVEFFDNLGQFVDRFVIRQDTVGSQYLNDGGVGVFYFTLEPDKDDMRLKTTSGRSIANGAYVVRGTIVASSTYLWCAGEYRKGDVKKSTETMLQVFGYRRGHE